MSGECQKGVSVPSLTSLVLGRFFADSWQVLGMFLADSGKYRQDLAGFDISVAKEVKILGIRFGLMILVTCDFYNQNRCLNSSRKDIESMSSLLGFGLRAASWARSRSRNAKRELRALCFLDFWCNLDKFGCYYGAHSIFKGPPN